MGQNIGAGHTERVRRGLRLCLGMSFLVALVMGGLVVALFAPAIRLFTDEPAVMEAARQEMWYLAPFAAVFTVSDILGGAMRGAGAATPVMFISAACICLFRILWLSVALRVYRDIRAVYLVYPVSWLLSSTAMTVYYSKRQKILSFTIVAMSFYRRIAAENDGSNQMIVTTFMSLTISQPQPS